MDTRAPRLQAAPITPPLNHHGEGPVWDPSAAEGGTLRWVDMLAGDLQSWTPATGWAGEQVAPTDVRSLHVGDVLACVRPRTDGGLVLALERRFALLGPDDLGVAEPRLLPEVWHDTGVRFNEGGCDPQGRFYCGSMAYDQAEGAGTLYRLDPDLTVTPVLTGATVSNGLAWAPDGRRAYYQDTPRGCVEALTFDTGGDLDGREVVVRVPEEAGGPDGLCVDAEGCIWTALYGGSAVHRYSPAGELLAVVEVGARDVTACTFGGPDLEHLFITTSAQEGEEAGELAGALFAVRPGVPGLPVAPFAG